MSLIDSINDQVQIIDLCHEFGIAIEPSSGGNFTHKCRCPSPNHKSGNERTPSLHIDSEGNNFYCYGCGAYRSAIDFYLLANPEITRSECISKLRGRVKKVSFSKKDNSSGAFELKKEMSSLFRYYNKKYPERRGEILAIQKKLDGNMSKVGYNDIITISKILSKLRSHLQERFK